MRDCDPCWHCRYFGGWTICQYTQIRKEYAAAGCTKRKGGASDLRIGCVEFEREPGADDEPHCVDPCGRRYECS